MKNDKTTPPKNQNELVIEKIENSLKKATIRGGFEIDGKITMQENLLGAPVSLSGRVKVQIENEVFVKADEGSMEVSWNIAGKCLQTQSPALDLIINKD